MRLFKSSFAFSFSSEPAIKTKTPVKIKAIPMAIFSVKSSLNNKTPIATAVSGSRAPMIEVGVDPIIFIALTIKVKEMMVGTMARKIAPIKAIGLFNGSNRLLDAVNENKTIIVW